MSPFEEVFAKGGPLVGAWDYLDEAGTKLYLFTIGDRGAQVVAQTEVPLVQHEEMVERLAARSHRVGGAYGSNTFVWVADDRGFAIWSDEALTASGTDSSRATQVTLFVDPADQGHRGVRLTRSSGQQETLVEERDPTPKRDPAYGHEELFVDSLWARFLGEALAVWFLVPFVDEVSGNGNDAQLKVARAARALAERMDGPHGELVESIGALGRATDIALRCLPGMLEVVVSDGKTRSAKLKEGTSAQIAAFLQRVSTPRTMLQTVNGLLRQSR
jgi:hypothetical protein